MPLKKKVFIKKPSNLQNLQNYPIKLANSQKEAKSTNSDIKVNSNSLFHLFTNIYHKNNPLKTPMIQNIIAKEKRNAKLLAAPFKTKKNLKNFYQKNFSPSKLKFSPVSSLYTKQRSLLLFNESNKPQNPEKILLINHKVSQSRQNYITPKQNFFNRQNRINQVQKAPKGKKFMKPIICSDSENGPIPLWRNLQEALNLNPQETEKFNNIHEIFNKVFGTTK